MLLSTLNDGQPCYIGRRTGRCRQDGKQNRRGRLVCKAQGNIVICTNTTLVYILYRKVKDIILNDNYIFLDNQWQCVLPHQLIKGTWRQEMKQTIMKHWFETKTKYLQIFTTIKPNKFSSLRTNIFVLNSIQWLIFNNMIMKFDFYSMLIHVYHNLIQITFIFSASNIE